jgi:ElaB/YqjD/DUF883 family membrane-anchored ribosome-binding protein
MESQTSGGGATQQVQEVAGQAQEKAQEALGQAQEKVQEVAGQAQEKVSEAAGQARGRLREQVDQRTTHAGEQVGTTARDIRSVAEELRKQDKDGPARVAEQAADRVERVGSYLGEADADRLLADVEDFARRQPWAVVAAGLAAGFLASRFLKASSSQRYQAGQQGQRPVGLGAAIPPATGHAGNGAGSGAAHLTS